MVIFKKSKSGRRAFAQAPSHMSCDDLPATVLRTTRAVMPECSELQVVRHFTQLSQRNFSIDTQFYPLGSCTMKYNPRGVARAATLDAFQMRHPLAREEHSQGFLACLYELQDYLAEITGMAAVSLTSMAGSQGELAGVAMIRAYHESRGDTERTEILVPDAAHGTNPASAVMCGYKVRELPTDKSGDINVTKLAELIGPQTAGVMLTNPSTLGVFGRRIQQVASMIHEVGGLLYYDGANLNAILGKVRPGDMGFDVMHLNLHKTFATPHGGGGPGSGPVAVNERLRPFLPMPIVGKEADKFRWLDKRDYPQSIGRLSAFMGNAAILLRAYAYIRMLGRQGIPRVANFATLNANYLQSELVKAGFELAYPERRASHEFIITLKRFKQQYGVTAMDVAKRLLDYGIHSPTSYFPLLVPECFLIEPTETESLEQLDAFVAAMKAIKREIEENPELVRSAPHTLPMKLLDQVKAATQLDLTWSQENDA